MHGRAGAPQPAIVPIQSLAPSPSPADGDEVVAETPDLVGSWVTYTRLVAGGIGPASLVEFIAAATQVPAARPSADTARAAPPPRASAPELPFVDINTLLYRGQRAQQRAQELRQEARTASGERLRALVEEVCDLVALAIEPGSPGQ